MPPHPLPPPLLSVAVTIVNMDGGSACQTSVSKESPQGVMEPDSEARPWQLTHLVSRLKQVASLSWPQFTLSCVGMVLNLHEKAAAALSEE